jgi:hypothetical protein
MGVVVHCFLKINFRKAGDKYKHGSSENCIYRGQSFRKTFTYRKEEA